MFAFLVDIAAVWRLTRLIVDDEIARPLRQAVDEWSRGYADDSPRGEVRYLINCPYCVSVWMGLLVASPVKIVPVWVRRALAFSALVVGARWAGDQMERVTQR